jgi:CRISPR-associated protein Cmr4
MFGVKWISSERILKEAGLLNDNPSQGTNEIVLAHEKIEEGKENGYINLGWLNLPYEVKNLNISLNKIENLPFGVNDIIIVPDSLISHIINSNLEVRTSVSIDPLTGAAKEKALFTSEAVPRGTVFYGEIRLFDKNGFGDSNLPSKECIWQALDDTKKYYETLGIGGMTTRGFGRMKILTDIKDGECNADNSNGGKENDTTEN